MTARTRVFTTGEQSDHPLELGSVGRGHGPKTRILLSIISVLWMGCEVPSDDDPLETMASVADAIQMGGTQDSDAMASDGADGPQAPNTSGPETALTEVDLNCPADQPGETLVDLGEVTLNVACQGRGPTIVMLHGFPEFWREWAQVMDRLAGEYRVVAPDQRGYNLSDKPPNVDDYHTDHLQADLAALLAWLGDEPVVIVAHDWGGVVGWLTAHNSPERVVGLVQINGPHPQVFAREFSENPAQTEASGYMNFFRSPLAESALSANDYSGLLATFEDLLTPEQQAEYVAAWSQPGALTAMLNWYRANDLSTADPTIAPITVDAPTLVLWGMGDEFLLAGNLDGLDAYAPDLEIKRYPDANHWLVHQEPASVADDIRLFAQRVFAEAQP